MDKLEHILTKLERMDKNIDSLNSKITILEERISAVETDVKLIKMQLENEIRLSIKRIAEGHLDLSFMLEQVSKARDESMMLALKLNMLETDVKGLKLKTS